MIEDPFPVAILAGGLASRLYPETRTIPKALIDINGEPFLSHQLRLLKRKGIQKVVLCVGYLGDMIVQRIGGGEEYGLKVSYSSDWPDLKGTAGAIKIALPLLSDAFLVQYGDSYLDCDYRAARSAFLNSGMSGLMTVYRNEGRWDQSNVEFRDGRIINYNKKNRTPEMKHIDYGLGAFSADVFRKLPEGQSYDLERVYQDLLQQDQLSALEEYQRFYEIGSPEGLKEMRRHLAEGLVHGIHKTVSE